MADDMATQAAEPKKPRAALVDLPPELLDHITAHLPTASSISNLGRASKSLHAYVEKHAWRTFSRARFPSTCPLNTPQSKETARTLTTLSRAWDRKAFVARHVVPGGAFYRNNDKSEGNITAWPGPSKSREWERPRGQTTGYAPQLDVYEEIGPTWRDRKEVLASTAGAEVWVRETKRFDRGEDTRWITYLPPDAREGRDDVTSMHLLRPGPTSERIKMITGTANGHLQLLRLPLDEGGCRVVEVTEFATQGKPVKSSSLWQEEDGSGTLLAASLGNTRIALYHVDLEQQEIAPSSHIDIQPSLRADGNPARNHRVWSTKFLSSSKLAVGVGPSSSPVHVYSLTESGLTQAPLRKFVNPDEEPWMSSIYTIVPLPSSAGSSGNGDIFLSGAYDGAVRLHDLRSDRPVDQLYIDYADDSAIYSILPRGHESFLAGAGRNNLLKVFDLRLGGKHYSYTEAVASSLSAPKPEIPVDQLPLSTKRIERSSHGRQSLPPNAVLHRFARHLGRNYPGLWVGSPPAQDYNIFLRSRVDTLGRILTYSRSAPESSVYSLASASPHSPYIYAGVKDNIWSLAFTEILSPNPDPVYFDPYYPGGAVRKNSRAFLHKAFWPQHRINEVRNLAMYEQGADMKLCLQRTLEEVWDDRDAPMGILDERWEDHVRLPGSMGRIDEMPDDLREAWRSVTPGFELYDD